MLHFILHHDETTKNYIIAGKLKKKYCKSRFFSEVLGVLFKPDCFVYHDKTKPACIDFIVKYNDKFFALISIYDVICFEPHFYMCIVEEPTIIVLFQ